MYLFRLGLVLCLLVACDDQSALPQSFLFDDAMTTALDASMPAVHPDAQTEPVRSDATALLDRMYSKACCLGN